MTNQYEIKYEQQKPFVAHQASLLFCDFALFIGNSITILSLLHLAVRVLIFIKLAN